jgi:hypothetical protein
VEKIAWYNFSTFLRHSSHCNQVYHIEYILKAELFRNLSSSPFHDSLVDTSKCMSDSCQNSSCLPLHGTQRQKKTAAESAHPRVSSKLHVARDSQDTKPSHMKPIEIRLHPAFASEPPGLSSNKGIPAKGKSPTLSNYRITRST